LAVSASRMGSRVSGRARPPRACPPGNPEAFIEAFANVYSGVARHVRALERGEPHTPDYPTVEDGVQGVAFVGDVLRSHHAGGRWVTCEDHGTP